MSSNRNDRESDFEEEIESREDEWTHVFSIDERNSESENSGMRRPSGGKWGERWERMDSDWAVTWTSRAVTDGGGQSRGRIALLVAPRQLQNARHERAPVSDLLDLHIVEVHDADSNQVFILVNYPISEKNKR